MYEMTGAALIVRLLERQGIRLVAGIPGGMNLPLYDALAQQSAIRHILARHEQGAGFMAQGIARITGKPAVCLATSGPGATNILTAIADAKLDSIPVVCITGQVPVSMIGTDAFQEVDTYGMTIPITKHNFLVRTPEELLQAIPEAFRIASSGRPGPVVVDVPKDVQMKKVRFEAWPEPGYPTPMAMPPASLIEDAAALINEAHRPVLYVGGGVTQSGAHESVRALAEKASIPVVMTLMGLGLLPHDHPLSLGMLGMHGARCTNYALEECDLLIAAGVRFDDRATGRIREFCPNAKIIHIDIDASEIDKIRPAHRGLVGDVKPVLEALAPLVVENERSAWSTRIAELRCQFPLVMPGEKEVTSAYGLIRLVGALAPDNAVIATDVGQHQMFTAQAYPFRRPGRWLTSGGLGTMGFGMPTAIGAALADPDATVICFSGDGSILMNIQEFATAVEEQVNIKVIILNNRSLGLVHQQQDLFYGQRIYASQFRVDIDFIRIAEGFGLRTYDLAGAADPRGMLTEALAVSGPCLIHAPVDVYQKVLPMVPPGAANREMIGGENHASHTGVLA